MHPTGQEDKALSARFAARLYLCIPRQNGAVNTYAGQGSLYLSGTLLVKNSKLCAPPRPRRSEL
jgi:hypothetical protein